MPGFLSVRPQDWATPTPAATAGMRLWAFGSFGSGFAYYDGSTWTDVTVPGGNTQIVHMAVDPENGANAWAYGLGGTIGLYRTTDSGATWDGPLADFPMLSNGHGMWAVSSTELFCCQQGGGSGSDDPSFGIFRSTDSGDTWTKVFATHDDGSGTFGNFAYGIRVKDGVIFYGERIASDENVHFIAATGGSITDAPLSALDGVTMWVLDSPAANEGWIWSQSGGGDGNPDGLFYFSGSSMTDRTRAAVASTEFEYAYSVADRVDVTIAIESHYSGSGSPSGQILRSTDRGANWTSVAGPSADYCFGDMRAYPMVAFNKAGHFYYMQGGTNIVQVSTDDGLTWTDTGCPNTPTRMVVGG